MIRRLALAFWLAGCARQAPTAPHVGHWSSEERRESVHLTDSGQFLLQREGRGQLALGSYTGPDSRRMVQAEVTWDRSNAAKTLTLEVAGDRLTFGLDASSFAFQRLPARPPADAKIVGLWENQGFERRDFTSYGCVITSFRGGGVKLGDYAADGSQLLIRDRLDPAEVATLPYSLSGTTLKLGTATLQRVAAGPWR